MSVPPWPPPPPRPLGVPAAAPARRPTSRSWQIGLLVLALVGSLGLAWGVRPESTTPDVRASRFVGGAGTNTVLGSGEQSMVVETSHYSGATYLVDSIGAHAVAAGPVWRVRYGPYPSQEAAQAGVKAAAAKGFANVRVMANDAR